MGIGGLILPSMFGKVIAAEELNSAVDVTVKKALADAALNAAKSAAATCASSSSPANAMSKMSSTPNRPALASA
jgi:hypothetical protein